MKRNSCKTPFTNINVVVYKERESVVWISFRKSIMSVLN